MSKLVSIFDKKGEVFSPPMLIKHDSEAMRMLQVSMEDPKSNLARWPSDYAVYIIAHWDERTGQCMAPFEGPGPQFMFEVSMLSKPTPTPIKGA